MTLFTPTLQSELLTQFDLSLITVPQIKLKHSVVSSIYWCKNNSCTFTITWLNLLQRTKDICVSSPNSYKISLTHTHNWHCLPFSPVFPAHIPTLGAHSSGCALRQPQQQPWWAWRSGTSLKQKSKHHALVSTRETKQINFNPQAQLPLSPLWHTESHQKEQCPPKSLCWAK